MARRTFAQIAAAISRQCGGGVPYGEIVDAMNDANLEINTKWTWPWTRAESNILIQPPYNTGTVSCLDNNTIVTLTGGTWDTNWNYKRLFMGQSNIDLEVFEVLSSTTLQLKQPINFGQNVVDQAYTLYQDMYALPDDCEFGNIILIVNPIYRYRLRYIPVYVLDTQSVFSRMFFSNFQTGFSDCGYDENTERNLIRMAPAPGSASEYRLVYRRRAVALDTTVPAFGPVPPTGTSFLSNKPLLPESWDRLIELYAGYLVRSRGRQPMAGWMEMKAEAYQLIVAMRRKMGQGMYDNYASYWQYPYWENSSMYTSGLFIAPTVGGQ